MISKNKIKLIHSLELKKNRKKEGLFVAEGGKLVGELMAKLELRYVAALKGWLTDNRPSLPRGVEVDEIDSEELRKASLLQHPQDVIALFRIPELDNVKLRDVAEKELVLALDGVQDPGNLGTIVRLADWFGIHHIFCSAETVDVLNPKTVQATMGALARVEVHYVDLVQELTDCSSPIYGTHLDGENLYRQELSHNGVVIMGNEGKGVSPAISKMVNKRLYIPPYPAGNTTVESLNVAIATAIVCAEFRRR